MRIIEPYCEIWEQEKSRDGYKKQIERVGRVCYKSEDKITEDSYNGFVNRLFENKHYAMLEHGTIYLTLPNGSEHCSFFENNPYSRAYYCYGLCFVTTNYRVIIENNLEELLEYYSLGLQDYHEKRYTVHFVCDRGVSHEFVRHRVFSFAQESTRFCNYTQGKFGDELTFIMPPWGINDHTRGFLGIVERDYKWLISAGYTPEKARMVLPNCLKTELVMTGFRDDWGEFFNLRALGKTGKPHPQAEQLATQLMNIMPL